MAVKLKPVSTIKAQLGIDANGKVQKYFTHRCKVRMDKYVPLEKGNLRKNVYEGDNYVLYKSPYAHYMYMGILYVDPETGSSWARKDITKVPTGKKLVYHTAGTGPHWDRLMWSAEKDQVIQEVQDFIRRG